MNDIPEKVATCGNDNLSYVLDVYDLSLKDTYKDKLSTLNGPPSESDTRQKSDINMCNVFLLPNVARRFGIIIMLFVIASFCGNEVIRVNVSRVLGEAGLSINKEVRCERV